MPINSENHKKLENLMGNVRARNQNKDKKEFINYADVNEIFELIQAYEKIPSDEVDSDKKKELDFVLLCINELKIILVAQKEKLDAINKENPGTFESLRTLNFISAMKLANHKKNIENKINSFKEMPDEVMKEQIIIKIIPAKPQPSKSNVKPTEKKTVETVPEQVAIATAPAQSQKHKIDEAELLDLEKTIHNNDDARSFMINEDIDNIKRITFQQLTDMIDRNAKDASRMKLYKNIVNEVLRRINEGEIHPKNHYLNALIEKIGAIPESEVGRNYKIQIEYAATIADKYFWMKNGKYETVNKDKDGMVYNLERTNRVIDDFKRIYTALYEGESWRFKQNFLKRKNRETMPPAAMLDYLLKENMNGKLNSRVKAAWDLAVEFEKHLEKERKNPTDRNMRDKKHPLFVLERRIYQIAYNRSPLRLSRYLLFKDSLFKGGYVAKRPEASPSDGDNLEKRSEKSPSHDDYLEFRALDYEKDKGKNNRSEKIIDALSGIKPKK